MKRTVAPYALAIVLPPLAVRMFGKPFRPTQLILNLVLTLCFWVPGAVHALLIVRRYLADKPTRRVVQAMKAKWR